ncbi:MAG: MarR family transcriptional regulator [Clostridia bacterium]|nr:MarR family transcriptional regulator [Clostridia bacterium]
MDFRTLNLLFRCGMDFSHEKIHMKDLSDTECMICSWISSHPDCSQDEVAVALRTDKTTVAKAMLTLEAKGCVERTQDQTDKRRKRLRITDAGRERIADLMNIHNEWLAEVLKCLSPEEQELFGNCCERLLIAAEQLDREKKNGE